MLLLLDFSFSLPWLINSPDIKCKIMVAAGLYDDVKQTKSCTRKVPIRIWCSETLKIKALTTSTSTSAYYARALW